MWGADIRAGSQGLGWAGLGWLVRAFSAAWEGVRNGMELSQPEEEVEVLGDTTKSNKSKQT